MTSRWGSCTPSTGTIRISTRIAAFPDWVIDYVIVHELAHLHVPGHGADFWSLVQRYPRSERAIGYLMAKSGDVD
jgi:predicted metal-dependent hydrolase